MQQWKYEIGENTTYSRDTHGIDPADTVTWSRDDGSNITVTFKESWHHNSPVGNDLDNGSSHPYFYVGIFMEKPIKTTQEKKNSQAEKKKMKVWQKLFAKNKQVEKPEVQTVVSKEILFEKSYGRDSNDHLEAFLQKPIQLEPEYEQIGQIIEKARKTIVEVGYPMHEEAIKEHEEANEKWKAEYKQKQSLKRATVDNMVANKIKGFDI